MLESWTTSSQGGVSLNREDTERLMLYVTGMERTFEDRSSDEINGFFVDWTGRYSGDAIS